MEKLNILGINIHRLRKKAVLDKIIRILKSDNQAILTTPNPEIILGAVKDEELFYVLNKADLSIPDGFGLTCAAWSSFKPICRYPGADLVIDILKIAEKENMRAAVLAWSGGLSRPDDISFALKKNFTGLEFIVDEIERSDKYELNNRVLDFKPNILFVALGSPWQEKYIYHVRKKLPSLKLAAGIGGAFDFLAKKIKRAPKIIRLIGLEWLWRLIKQPWRRKRIYSAVIVFPYKFIRWRFIRPFQYRPNVACLLYKKKQNNFKICIVEREDQKGHWQIPQGGLDNDDIKTAGKRELIEEVGTDKFKTMKVLKNVYKYKFGEEISRGGILSKYINGYKGQKQSLYIAEFIGEDNNIKINYWNHPRWKWVDSENLVNSVHPIRKEATKIFLEKFNEYI